MSDAVTEINQLVGMAESVKDVEDITDVLRPGIDWIKGPFKDRWRKLLIEHQKFEEKNMFDEKNIQTDVEMAELQRGLAIYLFSVSRNLGVVKSLQEGICGALLNGRDSVAVCLGENKREYVKSTLMGAISCLTFWNILEEVDNGIVNDVSCIKSIAGGDLDARNKIDIVLDFGTSCDGKKVIRVIQLKSDNIPVVDVEKIEPSDLKNAYLGGIITESDALKMIKGAKAHFKPDAFHLQYYGVAVPNWECKMIGNVFGIINPAISVEERREFIDNFRQQARSTRLLPLKYIKNETGNQ